MKILPLNNDDLSQQFEEFLEIHDIADALELDEIHDIPELDAAVDAGAAAGIKNDEFCINNDECFFIGNDGFCIKMLKLL